MTIDSHLQRAFESVCKEAVAVSDGYHVSLYEKRPFYGGPEEGGWWGNDVVLVATQRFATEELAKAALKEVSKLANQLSSEAKKAFGEQCLREIAWLDARGLESDFLGEPDGESTYHVRIESVPGSHESRGLRHYE